MRMTDTDIDIDAEPDTAKDTAMSQEDVKAFHRLEAVEQSL